MAYSSTTIPANIHPWPLNPYTGTHNTSHNSSLAIFYSDQSIPTPWPFLVGSFIISLTLTIASGIIHSRTDNTPSNPYYVAGIQTINFIRVLTTFIAGVKAVAGNGGRFFGFTQVGMLLLSVFPPVLDVTIWNLWRILAGLNITVTLVMMVMMLHLSASSTHHYGAWYAIGGSCPRVVKSCDNFPFPYNEWEGCYDESTSPGYIESITKMNGTAQYAPYTTPGFLRSNKIALAEAGIGLAACGLAILFGANFLRGFCNGAQAIARIKERMLSRRMLRITYLVSVGLICCLAALAVPVHYVQQIDRSQRVSVMDGFGPLTYVGGREGRNSSGESWVDCFEVRAPTDKNGFWDVWIEDRTRNVVALLPFL